MPAEDFDPLTLADHLIIARDLSAQAEAAIKRLIEATPLDDLIALTQLRFAEMGAMKAVKALGRINE